MRAAAVATDWVAREIMGDTRAEQRVRGKRWLARKCLRLKPCLLLALILSGTASAQSGRIHRCIGENGEPTFSDRKCEPSAAAAPAPPGVPSASTSESSPALRGIPALPGAPAVTQTCPISPEDLRDRVEAAFQAKNAVGLSGLFLWDGFGGASAIAPLRELAGLIAEPVVSIEIDSYARYPERDRYYRRGGAEDPGLVFELVIRTVAEHERRVPYEATSRFEMAENLGCWWLLLPL